VQPLREVSGLWKFSVERSVDRREYRLRCARGEFLMLAKVSKDGRHVGFFLYDSRSEDGGPHDPDMPAFTMSCNPSRTEWKLVQDRCDCQSPPRTLSCGCRERPVVMEVLHSREGVGAGVSHCLDVLLCPNGNTEEVRLVSQLPVWNEQVQSMVLDFKGRQAIPSAKNFQLVPEGHPERTVCQHAKIGPHSFSLDFKGPMTVIQAFGVALTTTLWI